MVHKFLRLYEVLITWRLGRLQALKMSIESYLEGRELTKEDRLALGYVNSALRVSRRRTAIAY